MAKSSKNPLFSKLNKAHEEHKGDETRVGSGGNLPAGIDHGIARLVDAKIGVYKSGDNEGEPFFYAAGVVLEPDSVSVTDPKTNKTRSIPVKGLRTQIGPEPICDTTSQAGRETSLADHWDRILNWLRLLGIDTKTIEVGDIVAEGGEDGYESGPVLGALIEAAPTFRFRTWASKPTTQYPNPRTNHEWRGLVNYEDNGGDGVEDDTDQPEWESEAEAEAPEEQAEEQVDEGVDYAALADLADNKPKTKAGKEAAVALAEAATAAGIDESVVENADSWAAVAEMLLDENANNEVEEEFEEEEFDEEEPEEWVPVEGEMGVADLPKVGKVEVEFVKVYAKGEKADIKRGDTNRITKGVPFSRLSPN